MKDPFKGELPDNYLKGMNVAWKAREKLIRLIGTGALSSEDERHLKYARDLLFDKMVGKGKRYDERDR
jgi:hypothetical protein